MKSIYQGSTPKITLKCNNFDPRTYQKIEVTIKNGADIIVKKHEDLVDFTENSFSFYLTQEETLGLDPKKNAHVQMRLVASDTLPNSTEPRVEVTNIQECDVFLFLGKGSIK